MKRLLLVPVLLLIAAPALAEGTPPIGLRLGYTDWEGISQTHVGAHAKLGDIAPNFALTPGFELGFGDDVTVLTLNGDVVYRATEAVARPWGLYGGGSLSLNYVDTDFASDTDLGLSALAGVTYDLDRGDEVMVELRLGVLDSPGLKLTFGYTFF